MGRWLGRLGRSVVLAAAGALVLMACVAPWLPPSACPAGPSCMASLSDTRERIGDGDAIIALFDVFTDQDSLNPTLASALVGQASPRVIAAQAWPHVAVVAGARRPWLPDKTGPPRG